MKVDSFTTNAQWLAYYVALLPIAKRELLEAEQMVQDGLISNVYHPRNTYKKCVESIKAYAAAL